MQRREDFINHVIKFGLGGGSGGLLTALVIPRGRPADHITHS